eukprot:2033353-Prymnesium_polylepis.1
MNRTVADSCCSMRSWSASHLYSPAEKLHSDSSVAIGNCAMSPPELLLSAASPSRRPRACRAIL